VKPDVVIAAARLDVGADEVARLAALLGADEQERAMRFVLERDRRRFLVARGRLREWLGAQVGVAADRIRFEYGARGKPLIGRGPHFSVSHSGERVVLALSERAPVGIDVEERRVVDDALGLARSVFAADELAAMARLPAAAQRDELLMTWTRKEAVIKATGLGVAQALAAFSTRGDDGAARLRGDPAVGRAEDWTLVDVAVEAGYPAAVAVIAPGATVGATIWLDGDPGRS
jgi:4'-phosphopantetheinyl transferase